MNRLLYACAFDFGFAFTFYIFHGRFIHLLKCKAEKYIHLILKSLKTFKQRVLNITKRYQQSNRQHTLLPSSSVTAISNSQPLTTKWMNKWIDQEEEGENSIVRIWESGSDGWGDGRGDSTYHIHSTWVRCHPFKILLLLWNITKYACTETHRTHHANVSVRTNMIGIVFRVIELSCYLWMNGWLSVYEQKV